MIIVIGREIFDSEDHKLCIRFTDDKEIRAAKNCIDSYLADDNPATSLSLMSSLFFGVIGS